MALIIGVNKGDVVFFNDEPVKVLGLYGYEQATLLVRGKEVEISDMRTTEIMPGVYVSCGLPKIAAEGGVTIPRLVIEAPRSTVVLREELYYGGKPKASGGKAGVLDPA